MYEEIIVIRPEAGKQGQESKRCTHMMSKKGQGLSLNTVIIAIIVLVVLVVLVMIFTGYFGKIFTPTVANCETAGGECATECGKDDAGKPIGQIAGAKCPATGAAGTTAQLCCQRAGKKLF